MHGQEGPADTGPLMCEAKTLPRAFLMTSRKYYLSFVLNVSISNALNPLSPQKYVVLRKVMIKFEYQRRHPLLREEEKLHLEALKTEAKEICLQLKENVFRMTQQKESLKEMYRKLTEMCHKPDTELLQVRKECPSSEKYSARRVAVTLKCSLHIPLLSAKKGFSLTPIIVFVHSPILSYPGNFWKIFCPFRS